MGWHQGEVTIEEGECLVPEHGARQHTLTGCYRWMGQLLLLCRECLYLDQDRREGSRRVQEGLGDVGVLFHFDFTMGFFD